MEKKHSKNREVELAFAAALREIRKEAAVSQEKLAFESGYHPTYISLLERGMQNPSLRLILNMAPTLGVSAARIVERVEDKLGKSWKREKRSER